MKKIILLLVAVTLCNFNAMALKNVPFSITNNTGSYYDVGFYTQPNGGSAFFGDSTFMTPGAIAIVTNQFLLGNSGFYVSSMLVDTSNPSLSNPSSDAFYYPLTSGQTVVPVLNSLGIATASVPEPNSFFLMAAALSPTCFLLVRRYHLSLLAHLRLVSLLH